MEFLLLLWAGIFVQTGITYTKKPGRFTQVVFLIIIAIIILFFILSTLLPLFIGR